MAMAILPAGARVDLSRDPQVCLDFARLMKERLAADGQPPTRIELNVTDRGRFYHWLWT
jgi:hypothetical protein